MNYLVTGGCGFIGSNFVEMLLKSPSTRAARIIVVDKLTYAANLTVAEEWKSNPRIEFYPFDINDYKSVRPLLKNIDVVVNFAAESHVDNSILNSEPFWQSNILGMQRLLQSSFDASVKTFVQISTDEVYGSTIHGSFDETAPLLPNSPYAASKASAEMIARSYVKTYGYDIRITRTCNNYGKNQFPEKFIPVVISKLSQNKSVPIYGSGLNSREWISVTDNCRAILNVILHGLPGEIYNIGTGFEISNLDLAKEICIKMKRDISLLTFVQDRKGHDLRYSINSDKYFSSFGEISDKNLHDDLDYLIEIYS